jgi:hypothetical protein
LFSRPSFTRGIYLSLSLSLCVYVCERERVYAQLVREHIYTQVQEKASLVQTSKIKECVCTTTTV